MSHPRCLATVAAVGALVLGACSPCDETPVQIASYLRVDEPWVSITEHGGRAYVGWSVWSMHDESVAGTYLGLVGGGRLRLSDGASTVTVGSTARGVLACWETFEETRCALYDQGLRVVRPPHVVDLENIASFVTFRGQLYAQIIEGIFPDPRLVPIEADGTPAGDEEINPLCFSFGPLTVGATRIACVSDNRYGEEQRCSTPDGADAPCEVYIQMHDGAAFETRTLVGDGSYPVAVASGDAFLVSWSGCDGTCYRVVHADGTMGPISSSTDPNLALYERDGGFVAAWPEDPFVIDPTGPPNARLLDEEGAPVGEVFRLAPPGPIYGLHGIVPTDDGFTGVWNVLDTDGWRWSIHARAICNDG